MLLAILQSPRSNVYKITRPCLKNQDNCIIQQNHNRSKVNKGKKRRIQCIITSGNSAKPF